MLGRALIRQKKQLIGNTTSRSQLHTLTVEPKKDGGMLESITEQTNIADFMNRVEMGEHLFEARTELLTTDTSVGVLTTEQKTAISRVQMEHSKDLRIPRRPFWDENTSAEELHDAESDSFAKWRLQLSKLSNVNDLTITPYEKNPHVWRQLWRVVERSDVVVQIVDARNPLLFRCTDLENYVREGGEDKVNLLLVNKSDFLTEEQRKTWTDYFNAHNIYAVFFSALASTIELDEKEGLVTPGEHLPDIDENEEAEQPPREEDSEESLVEDNEGDCEEGNQYQALQDTQQDKNIRLNEYVNDAAYSSNKRNNNVTESSGVQNDVHSSSITQSNSSSVDDSDNSSDYEDALSFEGGLGEEEGDIDGFNDSQVNNSLNKSLQSTDSLPKGGKQSSSSCQSGLVTSSALYNREELIALLSRLAPQRQLLQSHTTIGLVGYPNVGKSSTINCLMAEKKVTVSATPGKTKHFQTHHLSPELVLCDCPGLVFPGFVSTKQEMILWGILPIDRMKGDYNSAVSVLCQTLPSEALEATYSVPLPAGDTRPPTAEEFLSAISLTRSFMSARGRADTSRAARTVLKDFMNGRLLHCIAPPNVHQDTFHRLQQDAKTKKRVQLTPQQKMFMPETEMDLHEHLDFILGINTEEESTNKGKKPRKQKIRKPKGYVEVRETEDGPELVITKPWRNKERGRREGKKNPNTNNPYDNMLW